MRELATSVSLVLVPLSELYPDQSRFRYPRRFRNNQFCNVTRILLTRSRQPKRFYTYFHPPRKLHTTSAANLRKITLGTKQFSLDCRKSHLFWFVHSRAILSSNQIKPKPIVTPAPVSRTRPVLGVSYIYLVQRLIGSLDCLCPFVIG